MPNGDQDKTTKLEEREPTTQAERVFEFFEGVKKCQVCFGTKEILVPTPDLVPPETLARILIIGEQPNREESAESGTNGIFHPDGSSTMLREYLDIAKVDVSDIFYTTAVLCHPEESDLRPGRPKLSEAKSCSKHLVKLIEILRPRLIIPLGHTATHAVQNVYANWTELRQFILNYDIGTVLDNNGVAVYPLLHACSQTLATRNKKQQVRDWKRVPTLVDRVPGRTATS